MIIGVVLKDYTHGAPKLSPVAKATADNLQKAVIKDTRLVLVRLERDSRTSSDKK